jgi:membrane protein YdbS with pleckstrin-like domain
MGEPSEDLRRALRDDETMLWHERPDRNSYAAQSLIAWSVLGALASAFVAPVWVFFLAPRLSLPAPTVPVVLLPFLLVVGVGLVFNYRRYENLEYAVTDQRLLKVSGFRDASVDAASRKTIQGIERTTGRLDAVFDTGTVHVTLINESITFDFLTTAEQLAAELESTRERAVRT